MCWLGIGAQIAYTTNGYGKVQHLEEIDVGMEGRKKMRLIDADKLIASLKPEESVWVGLVLAEQVANAETVEAIPIEFIKQLIEKFDCERGNAIKDTFAHILTGLIEFWEFEQEKENDSN